MKDIIISTLDRDRILQSIDKKRSTGRGVRVNLNPLLNELNRAKILTPEKMPSDVVTMRSIVKLVYKNTGKVMQVQLVYPNESDMANNKISVFAPIATALLGYRKGDTVFWKVPGGDAELIIDEIVYQPEAAGDFMI
jgi:regulator of nucleoside diphosphate kinase